MSRRDLETILDDRIGSTHAHLKNSPFVHFVGRHMRREIMDIPPERRARLAELAHSALERYTAYEQADDWYPHREISRLKTFRSSLETGRIGKALHDAACLDILYARIDKIGPERHHFLSSVQSSPKRFEL